MRYNAGEIITAMITPFSEDLSIDYNSLEKLINHLIKTGTEAVLVAGTTGETPTLSHEEESELFDFVKKVVNGRIKIIMGAGSNSTETAIKSSLKAKQAGADAILSVVPYYNKPSQTGIYEHFAAIAKSVDLPVILYNIPGRTGVNMLPATIAKLAHEFKNIVAVKQSNSDLDLISDIKLLCPEDFTVYCGDDSLTLPMMSIGAYGVISVASHIAGCELQKMIKAFKSGNNEAALKIHLQLYPLFRKLFMAPNPVPVKSALASLGIIKEYVRKPLVILNKNEKEELMSVINRYSCLIQN
ncbi:MAG: 4-hydroxy-tetrahydrodipicolinate synthase [Candidatus Gastranaerophilales bacterium]|nr:4-hydroxy-tetrahydrodipicolinate synthase [Candidatus Gastranaerophilales bacterium]